MGIFFTSDHHFGHKNIIQYAYRPFEDVEEMDTILVERWNEVVTPDDIVYHLGDFCFGNKEKAYSYFIQLSGKIYMLYNPTHHDKRWIEDFTLSSFVNKELNPVVFIPPIFMIESGTTTYPPVVISHFPLREWERKHYGSIHLHGHSHGRLAWLDERAMDVGVDTHNFYPYSLNEVLERFL